MADDDAVERAVQAFQSVLIAHDWDWTTSVTRAAMTSALAAARAGEAEALDRIHALLDGRSWTTADLNALCEAVASTGRRVPYPAAQRGMEATLNGLTIRDWFDIAVAKEQAIDGYLTRIAELEAGDAQRGGEAVDREALVGQALAETIPDGAVDDDTFDRVKAAVLAARGDAAPTEVEWGVRWSDGRVEPMDQATARVVTVTSGTLVRRTVSAWREVRP